MSKLKIRNFEYKGKRDEKKPVLSNKMRNIIIGACGVLVLLFIVLVCIEPMFKNKLVIHNKSSHKIISLQLWYEDSNGIVSEVMTLENVDAKEKVKDSIEALKISELYGEAWITFLITFEDGGEALLQTGQYLYGFEGKISLVISDTDADEVKVHLQAGEGLFNSTAVTDCDDIYYINPKNGYIE